MRKEIFLWSLIPVILLLTNLYLAEPFRYNNDITFPIIPIIAIIWGVIAGLSHKDDKSFFSKYTVIKKPFFTLFLSSVFMLIIMSLWIQIFDPVSQENVIYAIFLNMLLAFFFLPTLILPFFIGFIISVAVRFASDKYFRN
jgi:hypothetical protein